MDELGGPGCCAICGAPAIVAEYGVWLCPAHHERWRATASIEIRRMVEIALKLADAETWLRTR